MDTRNSFFTSSPWFWLTEGDAGGAGSEDCLNVNIYTPTGVTPSSKCRKSFNWARTVRDELTIYDTVPVLVYIHGGGELQTLHFYFLSTDTTISLCFRQPCQLALRPLGPSKPECCRGLSILPSIIFWLPHNPRIRRRHPWWSQCWFPGSNWSLKMDQGEHSEFWWQSKSSHYQWRERRWKLSWTSSCCKERWKAIPQSYSAERLQNAFTNTWTASGKATSIFHCHLANRLHQPLFDFYASRAGCGTGSIHTQLACLRQASVSSLTMAQDAAGTPEL